MTTTPVIYSVGTLVEVDNTKTGYIIETEDTNDDIIRFKISYLVGNEIEEHVNETRCRPVSLRQASSTCSGAIRHALPQSTNPPPQRTQNPHHLPPLLRRHPKQRRRPIRTLCHPIRHRRFYDTPKEDGIHRRTQKVDGAEGKGRAFTVEVPLGELVEWMA